jgi:signal transduction histidine kinase
LSIKLPLKYSLDAKIILVALFYYFAARLGYFFAFENSTALPAWPPSGIAFALIILLGRSTWPGITIGSLVANIMAYWNNPDLPPQTIIIISTMIAFCNTAEAVVGNYFIKRSIKSNYPFKTTKNAYRFLFVTLLMCSIGAGLGTWGLSLYGIITETDFIKTGFSWWVGNVVGVLLFTPLILSCSQKIRFKIPSKKAVEVGIFSLTLTCIYLLLQVDYLEATLERALPFLVLPFLLWLAFRFDLLIAMGGVLVASLASIYVTILGEGPFALMESYNSTLLLQIFIGVMSISTIILSSTVKERLEVQRKLVVFNENLENIVLARTHELNDEIDTRKMAEEKLQRTNQELSKRNTELDNFVYSVSHDLRAPIASVLGLVNLAKKDIDVHMKNMYLDMISKSALQQDHFIKEILDQSKNARLEVQREEILFEPLINEAFNQLKFETPGPQLEKVIHINQDHPFFSDRWRLKVILNNILSNAIRYRNGHDPIIKINVDISENGAVLAIEDNGRGIEKDHMPNIYKMFYRATDDGAGSGLGLYIVKETIEKLNGHVNIESEVGKGTTVKLEIPALG